MTTTFLQNNWMALLPKPDSEECGNKDESMIRLFEKMQNVKTGFQDKSSWNATFNITVQVLAQKN